LRWIEYRRAPPERRYGASANPVRDERLR